MKHNTNNNDIMDSWRTKAQRHHEMACFNSGYHTEEEACCCEVDMALLVLHTPRKWPNRQETAEKRIRHRCQ